MSLNLRIIFCAIITIFCCSSMEAQKDTVSYDIWYPDVDENKIVETKWKYTYALHLESNTIIHQARDDYEYFLNLKFDYTYQQYLNGELTKGNWSLNGNELFYSFRHINKFTIAKVNKKTLILEFKQTKGTGTYQYHYVRVDSENAPFVKPANELPDVNVEALNPNSKKQWWVLRKSKKRKKKNKSLIPEKKPIYINIELIGGGYYGGIDPVLRDYIQIKSNGRLIKEFKSVHNGLIVTKKNIPREELEQFAEYIISKKFFNFQRMYDCESNVCQQRKHNKPTPIPLRLAVAYGNKKRVVTISIWGKDDRNIKYVDYPPALDHIIDAIQRMASRVDPS